MYKFTKQFVVFSGDDVSSTSYHLILHPEEVVGQEQRKFLSHIVSEVLQECRTHLGTLMLHRPLSVGRHQGTASGPINKIDNLALLRVMPRSKRNRELLERLPATLTS